MCEQHTNKTLIFPSRVRYKKRLLHEDGKEAFFMKQKIRPASVLEKEAVYVMRNNGHVLLSTDDLENPVVSFSETDLLTRRGVIRTLRDVSYAPWCKREHISQIFDVITKIHQERHDEWEKSLEK